MGQMYDVFLSFKNTDGNGAYTKDREMAHELYISLSQQGLSVFFSEKTLYEKGTSDYMRAIDNALDDSSILVAVGTSRENLESEWVRYEWSSFFNDIRSGNKEKQIISYIADMRCSDLPRSLRQREVFEAHAVTADRVVAFIQNALKEGLAAGSESLVGENALSVSEYDASVNLDALCEADCVCDDLDVDGELSGQFDRLFGKPKTRKIDLSTSNMVQEDPSASSSMCNLIARNYASSIEGLAADSSETHSGGQETEGISLVPIGYLRSSDILHPVCGKHFAIPDIPGYKSIIFQVYEVYDYESLTMHYECEALDCLQRERANGDGSETVYFVDDPQPEGNQLLLLSFNQDNSFVLIWFGCLIGYELRLPKTPTLFEIKSQHSSKTSTLEMRAFQIDDNMRFRDAVYEWEEVGETELNKLSSMEKGVWYETAIDPSRPIIIIDSETATPVKRKVYYDEKSGQLKAKINLVRSKIYFCFEIREKKSNKCIHELSDFEIANYYADGKFGFPKDPLKAVSYYEEDGSADALYGIAVIFRKVSGDPNEESYLSYLNRAVDAGCVSASAEQALNLALSEKADEKERGEALLKQVEDNGLRGFLLGYLIEFGHIGGSLEEAYAYYLESAQEGYRPACARLGVEKADIEGTGSIETDFINDAEYGHTVAAYCMGCVLFFGLGLLPNKPEGIRILKKAAAQGNRLAIRLVCGIFDEDSDFENEEEALIWLKELESFDHSFAARLAYRLTKGIGCPINDENDEYALKILVDAAHDDDMAVKHNLAWMYENGRGCAVDYDKALKFFKEAKRPNSYYYLGEMFERGLGVTADIDEAIAYYKKGAELESKLAIDALARLNVEQ